MGGALCSGSRLNFKPRTSNHIFTPDPSFPLSPLYLTCYRLTDMTVKDPYSAIKGSLPLLDHMHRFLLPGISRDMAAIMRRKGMVRVLDVACGTGYTACALRRKGFKVTGVDLSPEMLLLAAQKASDCRFVRGDGTTLPFANGAFDGAIISLALHEMFLVVREMVWSEMKRVVRPGGGLFILDFAGLPARRNLYSKAAASAILAAIEN